MARKKNIQFLLRTDEPDANKIRKKISASGLSQQDYLLKAALEAPIINLTDCRQLLIEYKKQGNNLNQIAKAINGHTDSTEMINMINELETERGKMWLLLKLFTQVQA